MNALNVKLLITRFQENVDLSAYKTLRRAIQPTFQQEVAALPKEQQAAALLEIDNSFPEFIRSYQWPGSAEGFMTDLRMYANQQIASLSN